MSQPVFESCRVDFDPFSHGNEFTQNLINDIGIGLICIETVVVRTVADNIIEMTVYIEVGIGVQVFQNGFEVLAVSSFFGASFIVFRVIGIDSVNNVGGTDDKIKRMSGHRFAVDFRDVGLQTDFDSKTNGKTVTAGVLKTAETVSRQVEQMKSELRGEYVAVSDFGTYLEKTSQEIEEDPTKITRYFKFAADIQADVDKVDADFSDYKTDVQGYIRQGIVDYDGVTPIIGIAIGQDIRTTQTGVETEQGVFDVIDKRSNMSVWTTEKLSFYIGGQEAAYFSNGKLTVAQIATNRITGAGGWDVSFTGGVKFKWIGG